MMMAGRHPENTESTSASHLLDFVSNASKELKDMLGKVDNDEKTERNPGLTSPGLTVHLPATPMMASPVPSPTPSCVSSISDQEVPSMSPRFFASSTQRRVRRKRSFDSSGEAPSLDLSDKFRRTDSVGDYEEYYPSCAVGLPLRQAGSGAQASSVETERRLQYESCRKLHAHNSYHFDGIQPVQQQLYSRPMQQKLLQHYDSFPFLSNQQHYSMQNTDQQQVLSHQPFYVDPAPDFADLVSWMLAEDFLDAETLSALLSRC